MLFPRAFWGALDTFGLVHADPARRGAHYLFYAYDGVAGGPVLAALAAGRAAEDLEAAPDDAAAAAEVLAALRGVFGPRGVEVPAPLQVAVTRWGADPLARGSYSSVPPGDAGPRDYDAMAAPLGGRVFFAGEATTRRYPATMHGAFATGLREAARVADALEALEARGGGGGAGAGAGAGGGGGAGDGGSAERRRKKKQKRAAAEAAAPAPAPAPALEPAAAEAAQRLEEAARMLAEIFGPGPGQQQLPQPPQQAKQQQQQQARGQQPQPQPQQQQQQRAPAPPDLHLGCLRAVFGPPGSGFEGDALVALDTGAARGAPRGTGNSGAGGAAAARGVHVFAVLARAELEALEEVRGGDEARLALLLGSGGAGSGSGGEGDEGGAAPKGSGLLAGRRSLATGRGRRLLEAVYAARCGGGGRGGGRGGGGA